MSACAEVYLSVSRPYDVDKVVEVVEKALNDVGFSGATAQPFISGHIWEARGWSVAWDVFEQEWADSLVKAIYEVAPEADAELYVYNLEREADVVSRTKGIKEDDEPQGCDDCGNVDHTCVCDGGIGPRIPVEVIK